MASLPGLKAISLPLRSRTLADPKATDIESKPAASKNAAGTAGTSAPNRRTADDLYPSGDSSEPPSPLPLFPDGELRDPKEVEILKDIEKTAKDGPEPLAYYWNTATFDWREVITGQDRKAWDTAYPHINLTHLARQMRAFLDEYGLDHAWKRETPLLEFCVEHNFVIQKSFQPGNIDAAPAAGPLSPGIVESAEAAIRSQPQEMRQWYHRAIEGAKEPEMLLKKAPPCHLGIRYGNPFARITQRDVLDWVTKNACNFKASTDWESEFLPQEHILTTRAWLVDMRWKRWIEAFPNSVSGMSKEVAQWFSNRTYLHSKATELVNQLGIVVMPMRGDFGDFKLSYRRLMAELCIAYQPILIEKWRRFINCCERIMDDEDRLKLMKEKRDAALSEARSRVNIFEPPWANEWPRLGFGGKAGNIGGIYHLLTNLNSGSFGNTSLWVQYDESGRICDRIVTKDAQFKAGNEGSQLVSWGDSQSGQLLHEAYFMRLLSRLKTSDYFPIIEYESQAIFAEAGGDAKFYRLYMKQAEHGDLHSLLDEQTDHLLAVKGLSDRSGDMMPRNVIPPLAVWAIFEGLATAACFMKRGALPYDPSPPDWQEVVHMDIKPLNIFLTKPHDTIWPSVPQVKLGDFGGMTLVDHPGRRNPSKAMRRKGTFRYIAPECILDPENNCLNRDLRIDSAADVYSIGVTILVLMLNEHEDDVEQIYLGTEEDPSETAYELLKSKRRDQLHATYGFTLVNLVRSCIRTEPSERITAEKLWEEIFKWTRMVKKATDVPAYLRKLPKDQLLLYKPDRYARMAAC